MRPSEEQSLPARVAQQLLQRIMAQEFPAGELLPSEREIQETYLVSRPVAREAIKLLAARGLITVHPRQGASVQTDLIAPARDAMLLAFHHARAVSEDVLQVRMAIEPAIAALAAEHANVLQRRQLEPLLEGWQQMAAELEHAAEQAEMSHWQFKDEEFHLLLADMSHNPVFKILLEVLLGVFWRQESIGHLPATPQQLRHAAHQHIAIAEAVLARAGEQARQAMVAHLEYTHAHVRGLHARLLPPTS